MKTRLTSIVLCLVGATLAIATAGCPSNTTPPSTQPSAPTAQQQLNSIVADEQFAYAIASVVLTGQSLTDAQVADKAFRDAAAIVQTEINNGTVTPAQVATELLDVAAAVKTVMAKAPKPLAPTTKGS